MSNHIINQMVETRKRAHGDIALSPALNVDITDIAFLQQQHAKIGETLEEIMQHINNKTAINEDRLRSGLGKISCLLGDCKNLWPAWTRPSHKSAAKAQEVFNTPELFELILSHLEPCELLVAQQMNRAADALVKSSHILQHSMLIRHKKSGAFTAFQNTFFSGIEFKIGSSAVGPVDPMLTFSQTQISVAFAKGPALPRIGTRCRSMLICQPPIKRMSVRLSCCDPTSHSGWLQDYLKSDKGVTIGDVYDATVRLRKEHRLCHRGSLQDTGHDGFVTPQIKFEAIVQHNDDDPILADCRAAWEREDAEILQGREHKQLQVRYLHAKQLGKSTTSAEYAAADFIPSIRKR